MVVQAYILIQTEVGRAADVATRIGQIAGVTQAEDVTGPYDVIVRAEAEIDRRARRPRRRAGAGGRRHHPHPHLPGRPPLSSRSGRRRAGRLLGLLLAPALVAAGCSREVAVTPPAADASTRAVCARVTAALPQSVAGQDRRATTPRARQRPGATRRSCCAAAYRDRPP